MTDKGGYIYVLTNPSFPEYVKIGYADNVDERIGQLNRSECTPFAFRKYAVLHVASRLADKNIHKLIDKFKPELRAKENINGKMRIREFFAMSAEEAVDLLSTIGSIYSEIPQVFGQSYEGKKDQKLAEEVSVASERRSPFSFYKCGIQNGEEIVYVNNPSSACIVVGDREISYQGKKTSLTALAKKFLNRSHGVNGPLYFSYKGEILSALRKRLEDEGKYNQDTFDSANNDTQEINQSDDNILYFVMGKYDAKCRRQEDGYLLLKDSRISSTYSNSCRDSIKNLRKKHASSISAEFILIKDILFNSSSTAAEFVAGTSKNGKLYWKNKHGVLLKDMLEGENK